MKPKVKEKDGAGNIFYLAGLAAGALCRAGHHDTEEQMRNEFFSSIEYDSPDKYNRGKEIILKYVDLEEETAEENINE